MISLITDIPDYVAGFSASGTVTREDYTNIVFPQLERIIAKHGHIHFLLVLDTSAGNFTAGAWMSDVLAGIKHLTKWKKMAIVSDQKMVEKITNIMSPLIPGESKGFTHDQMQEAIQWVSSEA